MDLLTRMIELRVGVLVSELTAWLMRKANMFLNRLDSRDPINVPNEVMLAGRQTYMYLKCEPPNKPHEAIESS